MGARQSNEKYGKSQSKSRGSTNNVGRLDAFASGNLAGGASWATADAEWVSTVVVAITRLGGAVTFGLSRDEGAHSLTLMLDNTRKTLWYNGAADLNEELRAVVATLDGMSDKA